jgi:hypothetical protein
MSCDKEDEARFKVEPGYSPDGKLLEFSMVLRDHSSEAIQQIRSQLEEKGFGVKDTLEKDRIIVMGHSLAGIKNRILIVDD